MMSHPAFSKTKKVVRKNESEIPKTTRISYKERRVYKNVIVVPEEAVNELGWKGGQELELKVTEGRLVIEKKEEVETLAS